MSGKVQTVKRWRRRLGCWDCILMWEWTVNLLIRGSSLAFGVSVCVNKDDKDQKKGEEEKERKKGEGEKKKVEKTYREKTFQTLKRDIE